MSYIPADDTPETNVLASAHFVGNIEAKELFLKLQEQERKLAYVRKMGLRLGMMKSSDKPEPYLAHEWDENSDHERMFKEWAHSIGWEKRVLAANLRLQELREALSSHPCACQWLDDQLRNEPPGI